MPRPAKNAFTFNERSLKALKPSSSQADFMDTGLDGFGVRVFPSGRKTFFVRYRHTRGFRRFTLGAYPILTLRRARADAEAIIGRVATGKDPQAERREAALAPTFDELAKAYLENRAKRRMRPRSYAEEERVIRHDLLSRWRRIPATEIRRRDIALLLQAIVARGADVQANRTRSVISRIFAYALEIEAVEYSPVPGVRRPTEEQSRQRVLSDDEIRALWTTWETEGSVTTALLRMLLLTGQRKQEVVGMRWEDIQAAWWTIPAGVVKNKLAHRVYLSAQALRLLSALHEITGSEKWVFASPRRPGQPLSWVNKAKERFREATGITDWRPHDLRRTAATYMGRMGVSRAAIARVLNHAEKGVTAIYDRSTGEPDIEHALGLWGEHLDKIVYAR